MQGKVGTIIADGDEVGGFLLWKLETSVAIATPTSTHVRWKGTLQAYWLSKRVTQCTLRFHSDIEDAWWDGEMQWPNIPPALGVLIEREVDIIGNGQLKAGKHGC